MKIKKFIKNNRYYIFIFLFLLMLTYLFPYTSDDFVWGSYNIKFSFFRDIFNDTSLNGRYFGDLFAIIMSKNRIIRMLIMSITILLIIKLIVKYTKSNQFVVLLLILLMPLSIFKQAVVWTSGFSNYTISSLLFLYCFYLLKNSNKKLLVFIIFIVSSLFIENVTLFLLIYTIFINIKYYVNNKKINNIYLFAFLGSLIGSLIMFSHPGYYASFMGKDVYRSFAHTYGIIGTIKKNYFVNIYRYLIFNNYIYYVLLISSLYIYYIKNINKYSNYLFILFGVLYLIILYFIVGQVSSLNDFNILNGIISLIFIIIILTTMYLLFKKDNKYKYIIYILGIIIGLLLPLFVVNPIGPRNFLLFYIIGIILLLKIVNDLFDIEQIRLFKVIVYIIVSIFTASFLLIYGRIYNEIKERDVYIINNSCKNMIDIPRLTSYRYVWWENMENNYFEEKYKKYYNLNDNIVFIYYDYDVWKEKIKSISTCY